jgi:hypothetical protein
VSGPTAQDVSWSWTPGRLRREGGARASGPSDSTRRPDFCPELRQQIRQDVAVPVFIVETLPTAQLARAPSGARRQREVSCWGLTIGTRGWAAKAQSCHRDTRRPDRAGKSQESRAAHASV